MKKRLWKWMILAGMTGTLILGTCGCGGSSGAAGAEPEAGAEASQDPQEDSAEVSETGQDADGESGDKDGAAPADEAAVPDSEAASGDGGSASRKDGDEDLTGYILELGDGQFTVEVVIQEEEGDGMVMVGPAPGADDSAFDHVTVTYDKDTEFCIRTIYDSGARYEDADGSAADLSMDDMVLVWGTYGDGNTVLHADQIQIEHFVH